MIGEVEVQQIATAVAAKLQQSILKLPADVAQDLKQFAGWTFYGPISGHTAAYKLETRIMNDGGLQIRLLSPNGEIRLDRILIP